MAAGRFFADAKPAWLLSYERTNERTKTFMLYVVCKFYWETNRNEKYWIKNTRERSNLCLSRISYYLRAEIIGKSFSILCFKCKWVTTWVDAFKKLEETMHVHTCKISFSILHFWFILISFQIFFTKCRLPNSGCGLSASTAYAPVFTVLSWLFGQQLKRNTHLPPDGLFPVENASWDFNCW